MEKFEDKVRITGVGMSQVGRRLMRNPVSLAVDACLAAIADAGLTRDDIDGLAAHAGPRTADGYSAAGIADVDDVLCVRPRWHASGMEVPGHTGAVTNAALAVAAGLCRHVVVFRATWESTAQALMRAQARAPAREAGGVSGPMQWQVPFGAVSAANWVALYASRHFARYGTRREHLGQIALNARRNAALNPNAIYREPLTMEAYLGARMISTPFGLYDCDTPCDGAVAVVLSHVDAAADTRRPHPIRIEAIGAQVVERWSWDQGTLEHEPMLQGACDSLWARTDLKPKDVDLACLYDGFTFNCLSWLELMGFCQVGEAKDFLEGGARIARDGELPLNPHGGQLSAGRLQGFGHLHEACVQLWGEAGARQVPGGPKLAAISTGGGVPGGTMLLAVG
jgi:acetyl-CoA acetyltransferase